VQVGKCFVVCYGLEFNLRSLSVVALSEAECETWYRGLKYLIQVSDENCYPLDKNYV
jgi:phosphatidylinositol phospholipase C gamma-1